MAAERTRVAKRRRDAYAEINRRLDAYPIDNEWTRDEESSTNSVLAFFQIPNQRHDWRVASKEDIVGYLPTRSKIDQRSFCGSKFKNKKKNLIQVQNSKKSSVQSDKSCDCILRFEAASRNEEIQHGEPKNLEVGLAC
ncbi:unnamed protein product [Orchesella dallaii]|uniref:Uncharacterized protein n=1 Tax=Orchesella dallaii TaxID=48710 RepID=A0ABP1PRR5_9HEXA